MGLDEVDWSEVQSAYGPATTVPTLVRRSTSSMPAERENAIGELWGCLCHQGTVYEASAVAVPLLLDAAMAPSLTAGDRTQLLALLVHIGLGEDTTWEGYTPWPVVERCVKAVEAVLPTLATWAAEGNPQARTWTIAAAAYHPKVWVSLGLAVSDLMSDPDPHVAEVVHHALEGTAPDQRAVLAILASDADLRDYYETAISDLPPQRQARQLVLELAIAERL